jgi:DNA polymerase III subunit beta
VESELRSIGELARASGLTVSALRFYDSAGVLVPAMVEPGSGYRRYAEHQVRTARLVASLRRVGMSLAQINAVLGQLPDAEAVRRLLDVHLLRLETGLADARRELSRAHALLTAEEKSVTTTQVTMAAADLAAALDMVRFAVSQDPELPALGGIRVEVEPAALRLVATDRYRLAVCETAAVAVSGPPAQVTAPASFLEDTRALLAGAEQVTLTIDAATISAAAHGRRASGQPLHDEFPDYRRLLREHTPSPGTHRIPIDVPALRAALAPGIAPPVTREHHGRTYQVAVLAVDPGGNLAVLAPDAGPSDSPRIAVNREFLLQALESSGRGQLLLELDGPITPLAIRVPDDERNFSILMPVRL